MLPESLRLAIPQLPSEGAPLKIYYHFAYKFTTGINAIEVEFYYLDVVNFCFSFLQMIWITFLPLMATAGIPPPGSTHWPAM